MTLFQRTRAKQGTNIKKRLAKYYQRWLKNRLPAASTQVLSSRNIFIFPTKFGFAYLFFVVVLFLLATNYQNNLIMLLSYMLASFFITTMMHSFYNLSQLTLSAKPQQKGFAEQTLYFPIEITATKKHVGLTFAFARQHIFWQKDSEHEKTYINYCDKGTSRINIATTFANRGVYSLGRVKISSEYAFGFFVTWSVLDFDHQALVFPCTKALLASQYHASGNEQENNSQKSHLQENTLYRAKQMPNVGLDDFSELKPYRLGEPLSRIAWKQFAKGQGKLSKHYQTTHLDLTWLKLADMPTNDVETALSYLAFLIEEYYRLDRVFGLDLTSQQSMAQAIESTIIAPQSGSTHRLACLTALALFKGGDKAKNGEKA